MKYFVIFGVVTAILVSIGFAQPVSSQMMCVAGDEMFHFTVNDIVFIGTVTEIKPSESNQLWNYISFGIQYSFKGLTNQSEIVVPTHQGSTYGFEPEIGSTYLIHASNAHGVELFTNLCSDNKLLETEKEMEEMKNKLLEISMPPPLKQKQYGLASHAIKCKQNLVLIQKYDGTPACVKPETVPKLLERGWINNKLLADNASKLIKSHWDKDSKFIQIESTNQIPVNFNLQLPSYLPKGYNIAGYASFGSASIGHVLIAPAGYQGKTGYDFWKNNAIIIRYNANSNPAVDPMTSIKYQAKQNNIEPIELGNNCTVFLQSSSVFYDDSLSTFVPVLPELTAHYDNVFVHISGNVNEKEILLVAESILDNKSVNSC